MLKARLTVAFLLATALPAFAQTPQITNYLGTIDNNLPISVALDTNRQDQVTGTYVYSQYGKPLKLAGRRTFDKAPRPDYILKENDGTATFELNAADDGSLAGTWKSSDGKRTLPVALTPAAKTVTLVSAKSDRYQVSTGYLELAAKTPLAKALNARLANEALEAHNKNLKSLAADTDKEAALGAGPLPYVGETTPFLLFASDTLVSIRCVDYSYTGGAHGNWGYSAANYTWVKNALVDLLPEMIVPQSQWPALRDACVKDLTARKASWPQDIKFDKNAPPDINFTSRGLLVSFDPYQVGSYAEGGYVVSLPYAQSKSLIAPASALSSLLPK